MKHEFKITAIILIMFLLAQFIGLYVIHSYSSGEKGLPYGMETPELETSRDFAGMLVSIIFAFIIAITLFLFFTKMDLSFVLKIWFFFVIMLALGLAFTAILPRFNYSPLAALLLALPLALSTIYSRNILSHNLAQIFIFPGISAVFVPIFNIWTILIILVLISIYDMWAVWHSGIMQKMAKYQIQKLRIFAGFMIPSISKALREKIKNMKPSELKTKKIKVNIAVLGGGDIVFPLITAGVFLKFYGIIPALFVVAGATIGLCSLLFYGDKKKSYPAMPYITAGILLALGFWLIIF